MRIVSISSQAWVGSAAPGENFRRDGQGATQANQREAQTHGHREGEKGLRQVAEVAEATEEHYDVDELQFVTPK